MDRILVLIKGLGRGGAEQLLRSAVSYIDRDRFDIEIAYLLRMKDALVSELVDEGITVHCLDAGAGVLWVRRLRALVQEREVRLVHTHSPYAAVGARLSLDAHVHLIHTEHNVWERYRAPTYWGNALTFARNKHVFAVSETVRRSIRYPVPLRRLPMPPIETLYHGLDPARTATWGDGDGVRDEFHIPAGAPLVGTVANFKAHKGLDYLLRAASEVRRSCPDVRFILVGQGPLQPAMLRQVHDLGLEETVLFAGFRDDAPKVAAAFDVFVLPSTHEGLSIALLEAMALRRPSVVTDVGGLPETITNEVEGFIVPPRNVPALAGAILALVRDPGLRARMGAAAGRRAEAFDIRTAVGRTQDVYAELLA
jgi:glycosyltransferase involved in cell wall biosynthesis